MNDKYSLFNIGEASLVDKIWIGGDYMQYPVKKMNLKHIRNAKNYLESGKSTKSYDFVISWINIFQDELNRRIKLLK